MDCPSLAAVNSTLTNACAIQDSSASSQVKDALKTCCVGGGGPKMTSDGCFSYCNTTSIYDELHWSYCLLDILGQDLFSLDDGGCTNDFDLTATTIPVGNIATTWNPRGQTITFTESGTTEVVTLASGDPFAISTSSNPAATTSPPTGRPSTSSKNSPSSTSTALTASNTSSAGSSNRVSNSKFGIAVIVGLVLFFSSA